jgi:hypothetical protein
MHIGLLVLFFLNGEQASSLQVVLEYLNDQGHANGNGARRGNNES